MLPLSCSIHVVLWFSNFCEYQNHPEWVVKFQIPQRNSLFPILKIWLRLESALLTSTLNDFRGGAREPGFLKNLHVVISLYPRESISPSSLWCWLGWCLFTSNWVSLEVMILPEDQLVPTGAVTGVSTQHVFWQGRDLCWSVLLWCTACLAFKHYTSWWQQLLVPWFLEGESFLTCLWNIHFFSFSEEIFLLRFPEK